MVGDGDEPGAPIGFDFEGPKKGIPEEEGCRTRGHLKGQANSVGSDKDIGADEV